jgi:isoleucyl-tRNA synthetase
MFIVVDGLARLLAPILSVTMDELWRGLPGQREASVHMALFPQGLDAYANPPLVDRWTGLGAVRDAVNVALEQKRQEKAIAGNLSAAVEVVASGVEADLLLDYQSFLPTLFGVSQVTLARSFAAGRTVTVIRAEGVKCDRCWRVVSEVSSAGDRAGLCPRCVDALNEAVSL